MRQTFYYERGSEAHGFVTEEEHREHVRQEILEERERRRRRLHKNARFLKTRNKRIAVSFGIGVVLMAMFSAFVFLENGITESMQTISRDEETLSQLKADNSALMSRISTDASLSSVKKKAEKLGMKYASPDQIEYYTVKEQDYMSVNNR